MPRARISYEQRVIIEDMRKNRYKSRDICEALGISSYDYQRELMLGFTEEKKYSALKAQMKLK
ncbi:hypothetical protein [uncultured Eubacterium sp.]|uniref:hypothetical protein n=1 Tax=Eubacterium sp. TaxID=142586 RepID=UPI003267B7A1